MIVDQDLLEKLILPKVERPAQYVGGEYNMILKDWDAAPVKMCFAFPDTYEIGMSPFSYTRLEVYKRQANTLVLAYIGSSLSTTLLLVAYNVTFVELMNMELIVVELLQALVGSIGTVSYTHLFSH